MRGIVSTCLILTGFLLGGLISGCRSGREQKSAEGKFHEDDSSRTSGSSKNYFVRQQEKKRRYDREFKDVRHSMNQDHFQVFPWGGKHYSPRSESLHDSSREEDHSIFKF